ncbi:ATP-binding protein [Pseudorhodoferax soli]|uniref:Novel STAND NTPase 3 domain-containing protein n=1 Tax=Pseudorhodoferax soli TaxID=545864 RepID=A0A368XMK2_9BURK|nr:ATP-binding protein [Pseudorhodoferax soli]RCW69200.1 hypothetical protein DES41_10671 [Pseudorhodoferax soli]
MRTGQGGSYGLEGYLYQVLVSVWVAVDVLLVNKRAERVELEPASQEDIEADLTSSAPPMVGAAMTTDTYPLRVQVKCSSGDTWSAKRLRAVLEHGGPSRVPALQRLNDEPGARYLLITDNAIASSLRPIAVRDIGVWPTEWTDSSKLSDDQRVLREVWPRVAVLYGFPEDRVRDKLERHLETTCHVPRSRVGPCIDELYGQALQRMRVTEDHTWRKSDLEDCIKRNDGYLAESRTDEEYVKPKNWHLLLQKLTDQHAVIIKGESGTGKTSAARALILELRERVPGIEVVQATTPAVVRDCRLQPVVFYLDDPWGKSRFEPNAEPWRNELPSLLLQAGPARFFVATTRSDVFQSAELGKKHARWLASLESSDYEPRDRFAMFRHRLSGVPVGLRQVVAEQRGNILQELRSPYEIDQFFANIGGLETVDTYHDQRSQIDEAVQQAHIDAIQGNIREQVSRRNATVAAIVLWCSLTVSGSVDRDFLRSLHTRLSSLDSRFDDIGLDELVGFFVAGKSLRQLERVVSYGHPQVREALRHFISCDVVRAQSVLRSFCAVVLLAYGGAMHSKAAEALAKLSAALPREVDRAFVFEGQTGHLMNDWLLQEAAAGPQFEDKLKLLARAGTPNFVPAEVARFLTERGSCSPFAEETFEPFQPEAAWFEAATAEPSTSLLCRRFLALVLPHSHESFQSDFDEILQRIAGDLTTAYLDGVLNLVESGARSHNMRLLLTQAGGDIERLRPIAVEALAQYTSIDFDATNAEDFIAAEDCYYGSDYTPEAVYLWESASNSDDVLQHFVSEFRRAKGWQSVAADSSARGMEEWWLRATASAAEDAPPDPVEVQALLTRTDGTAMERRFWERASTFWTAELAPILLERLLGRTDDQKLREALVMCARFAEGGAILASAAAQLASQQRWHQLLELLVEVDGRDVLEHEDLFENVVEVLLSAVPLPQRRMLECVLQFSSPLDVPPSEFTAFVEELDVRQDWALLAVIRAKASRAIDPSAMVRRLLQTCKHGEAAAQSVAISAAFLTEPELLTAVEHKFGRVRAAAFDALVSREVRLGGELLSGLAKDRSFFVKQVISDYACRNPAQHRAVLHQLLFDDWCDAQFASEGESISLPFAFRAVEALSSAKEFSATDEELCLAVGFTSRDPSVRYQALRLVVSSGTTESRSVVVDAALAATPQVGRLEAAAALAAEVSSVDPKLATRIRVEDLLEVDAAVAVRLAKVVGSHLNEAAVRHCVEQIGADPERRVLLLPLGIGAARRPELLARIRGLLPMDTPALRVFQRPLGDIPVECLTPLGGHEEVGAVRRALKQWFVED